MVEAEAAGGGSKPGADSVPVVTDGRFSRNSDRSGTGRSTYSFLADYDAPGEAAAEAGGSSRATCDGGGPSGATAAADGGVLAGVCATLDSGAPLPSLREQAAAVPPRGSWDFSGYASSINADAERRSGDDVDEASAGAVPSRRADRSVSFVPVTVDADDGTRRATR